MPRLKEENVDAYCLAYRALFGAVGPNGEIVYEAIHRVLVWDGFKEGTEAYGIMFRKVLFFIIGWLEEKASLRKQEQAVQKSTRIIRR